MGKRINLNDIMQLWDAYLKIHGDFPPTKDEVLRGCRLLFRQCGIKVHQHPEVKLVSGRRRTGYGSANVLNVNPKDDGWREITRIISIRRINNTGAKNNHALWYKLSKRVCEKGWLAGTLVVPPKVITKPTKEQIRAQKIAHLEARLAMWQKKQQRVTTYIRKINRSLNALRRHHGV